MFRSMSSRISYMVAIVVIISTVITLFFIDNTLERDMFEAQGKTARNTIRMGLLYLQEGKQSIDVYRKEAYQERKQAIKDAMSIFYAQIDAYYSLYKSGVMTEKQAKEAAYQLARTTRYFNNDYFFIYTDKLTLLAHPDRTLEGQDLSKSKDKKGYVFGPDMMAKGTTEIGGFTDIWWSRLGSAVPVPKILYVKHFSKWNWILGTGNYVDDIENSIEVQEAGLIKDLQKGFSQIRLAETGRLFIFDNDKNVLVPPAGASSNFGDTINIDTGKSLIHDLKMIAKQGQWNLNYKIKKNDGNEIDKQAFVRYYAPLGWYIASTVPISEIHAPVNSLIIKQAAISLIILIVTICFIYYVVRKTCLPIQSVSKVAYYISKGDLKKAKKIFITESDPALLKRVFEGHGANNSSRKLDEIDYLVKSFHTMLTTLNSLVSQVQNSGDMVTGSSLKLSSAIGQLEIAVENQATATQELGSTSREISATSQELAHTMNEATEVALSTAELADQGVLDLDVMGQNMEKMRDASGGIFSKLSIINSKAANISSVVTSISKISEQINLLSLNAAIEAEKAGEFGQGFSVVAREIRKLADKTAMSTLDIEKIVAEMLSAVSSGVMEMDKFRQQVETGVSNVEVLGQGITGVVDQVRSLTPQFESVNEGMQNQSEGAEQISKAILQLSETSIQTKDALQEFVNITEQLSLSVESLEEEVAVFRVEKES
ncbi:methyl-accepting chemotaxis protein [Desulfovibrio sp. UCD-KL4C]|uniref:methyl-accepting chemotaxis protein n=1 Tax=Desulfovibrio sp. UCD-KL4C TaxID=2578120 RepID=UPI0025B99923|nr:methyl-accepting chemotaxis protein [Desulfovibrio sp. UCD-KL4C]